MTNDNIIDADQYCDDSVSKTHKCIYCLKDFKKATKEHILQNTFGGRKTSPTIVCDECQKLFAKTIDKACADFLKFFRNQANLGTGREKHNIPSINNVKDSQGRIYKSHPGGQLELTRPYVTAEENKFTAEIGTPKMKEWGLKEIKKLIGTDSIERIEEQTIRKLPGNVLIPAFRVGLGTARALLKSAFNLLAYHDDKIALLPIFDDLRAFIMDDCGTLENLHSYFRYPIDSYVCLPNDYYSTYSHQLYVFSRGEKIEGVIKIFDAFTYFMRLATNYKGEPFSFGYVIDPTRELQKLDFCSIPEVDEMPNFDQGAKIDDPRVLCAENEELNIFMGKVIPFQLQEEFKEEMSRIEKILHQKEGKRAD